MNRFGILVCGIATLLIVTSAANVGAAPRITFTATGATAEGIRPGGDAIWFVHTVTEFAGSPELSRVLRVTTDDDGDGRVALETTVSRSSVWVVVDYASGEHAIAAPEGAPPLRELRERGNGWAAGRAHVDFSVSDVDVLVVRPGRGAWTMRCFHGGSCDGDGRADANLRLNLSDMKTFHGGERTPSVALPRDLVIAVHPTELYIFVRSAAEVNQ